MERRSDAGMNDAEIRTHLANERTYLAWIRTIIVSMGIGLAVVAVPIQDAALSFLADLVGLGVLLVGGVLTVWAFVNYRRAMAQIVQGQYRPAWGIVIFALLLPAGAAVAIVTLLLRSG